MANEELKENKIEKKKIFNESRLSDILVGIFFAGGNFTRLTHWKAPVPPAAVDFQYQ